MKSKKVLLCMFIGVLASFIILLRIFTIDENGWMSNEKGEINEIKPEEEVPSEETYNTEIELYYVDAISGVIVKEVRTIDARKLIDNPYGYVTNLLIEGPKDKNLYNPIPVGTKLNHSMLKKNTLYIDFNDNFLNSNGTDSIYIILDTMYQFNEIENIKITINGEEKDGIREKFVKTD